MFALLTPVLIFQGLCLYHAYRYQTEQRWYWIILLLPVLGCIIYVIHHFRKKPTLDTIAESVNRGVNANVEIRQLESECEHADTVTNKINLADAYLNAGRVDDAIRLYEDCASGFMADDPTLRTKLLKAFYLKKDFGKAIEYGQILEIEKTFRHDESRIAYAWAHYHTGNAAKAEEIFESMDRSFSNYPHRQGYCQFLRDTGQREKLMAKLQELIDEFETMKGIERRTYLGIREEFLLMRNQILRNSATT